jgi:hypothetical protein
MDLDAGRRFTRERLRSLALRWVVHAASAWAPCGGLVLASCGGAEVPARSEQAVSELESLAFVAPAECVFPPLAGPPLACVTTHALLVDRYEVTRGQWRAWRARTADAVPAVESEISATWRTETDDWPATFMTLFEARDFAAARGMRLLTSQEWIRVACGPGRHPWPWGPGSASAVANCLDLELYRPVAVGTFEQGRSPDFVYDLVGNVWEWVDAPMPWPALETPVGLEWAMGGSYLSKRDRLYDRASDSDGVQRWSFSHQELDPRTRSCDVGLRCAAEARAYLRLHAADWGAGEEVRRRLIAVGAAWGRQAVPLLEELTDGRARSSAGGAVFSPGLGWLLAGARR